MVPRDGMEVQKKRQRLGIYLGENSKLDSIVDGSLAARAGLKAGDTLISIGDVKIEGLRDIRKAMNNDAERRKVTWQRGEETFSAWFDWKEDSVEKISS